MELSLYIINGLMPKLLGNVSYLVIESLHEKQNMKTENDI